MNPSALPGLSTFFSQWLFSLNFVFKSAGLLCLSPSQSQLMDGSQYALLKQLLISMEAVICWGDGEHSEASSQLLMSLFTSCPGIACHCPLWLPWGLLVVV